MATFDIETVACEFTEVVAEQLVGKGIKDIDYPTHDEVGTIRLWANDVESEWVEVLVTEDQGLKGILVEGDGQFRTPAEEWTETAALLREIQKLWEQFLKA